LVIGLRLLYESVQTTDDGVPLEERWLIEDEEVYLWAVSSSGELTDWAELLLAGGQVEAPLDKASAIVGESVVKHLLAQKAELEGSDKDATLLAAWSHRAPTPIVDRLAVANKRAESLAETRIGQMREAWLAHHGQRTARLHARVERAGAAQIDAAAYAELTAALEAEKKQRVCYRHQVLGTQLFVVLHS
jgi:hypothetical protein